MRYTYIILFLSFVSSSAFSQSLQEQIFAVDSSYKNQQSSEEKARLKAIAGQKARIAEQRTIQEKAKKREQSYEDDLRQIELENLRLDLQAKKAIVKRSDEYIDHELKEKAASTDVIQSGADAIRNLSDGKKEKMKSEGRAEEKKAKGLWGF